MAGNIIDPPPPTVTQYIQNMSLNIVYFVCHISLYIQISLPKMLNLFYFIELQALPAKCL